MKSGARMAKVIFGNHAAVLVPRTERDRIRKFYCDVLGCQITRENDQKDDVRMGENFHIAFMYGDLLAKQKRRPISVAAYPTKIRKVSPNYFFAAACFSLNSLIICSCVDLGTGWYFANSIENSPLPCVADRRSVEYPNISDSGTCAPQIR